MAQGTDRICTVLLSTASSEALTQTPTLHLCRKNRNSVRVLRGGPQPHENCATLSLRLREGRSLRVLRGAGPPSEAWSSTAARLPSRRHLRVLRGAGLREQALRLE